MCFSARRRRLTCVITVRPNRSGQKASNRAGRKKGRQKKFGEAFPGGPVDPALADDSYTRHMRSLRALALAKQAERTGAWSDRRL